MKKEKQAGPLCWVHQNRGRLSPNQPGEVEPGAVLPRETTPELGAGEHIELEREGASVCSCGWAYKGAVKSIAFQKTRYLVYILVIKRWFLTDSCMLQLTRRLLLAGVSNSCKGHMEREVAIYSEENLPGDIGGPLLGTSKRLIERTLDLDPFVQ